MINKSEKSPIKVGKREIIRFFRNFLLTLVILTPLLGLLLINDALMATAPMDKKPWVHWNGLDPSDEVYVSWETSQESASYVEYGTNSGQMDFNSANNTVNKLHRVKLLDLLANTQYYYRASNDNGKTWYSTGQFQTAPDGLNPANFSFAIVSDTQNFMGTGHYPRIARTLGSLTDLSFVAYAGDMSQDWGQTSILNPDSRQVTWNQFWQNTNQFTRTIPIVPDPGNHDHANAPYADNLYQRYFAVSNPPNHNYYSFNWSRTQFIMVQVADGGDDGRNNDSSLPTYQQDIWINKTLEASQSMDFRIMVFHRALFSSNGDDQGLIDRFMPIIVKYNVSICFYGHEHAYERYYVQNHTLVCLGNGGGLINGLVTHQPNVQAVSTEPGFTKVTCDTTGITLTTLSPTLNIIDQIRLNKVGSDVVPEVIKNI
jgi:Calcineurin-like phosphoesterase/Purple acid Phosphatase, N-terminal domain